MTEAETSLDELAVERDRLEREKDQIESEVSDLEDEVRAIEQAVYGDAEDADEVEDTDGAVSEAIAAVGVIAGLGLLAQAKS
jgi:ElaB/YqjD/DUF883 family membrane-anchored ribosome-binding protein